MSREDPQFKLRMPADLKMEIEAAAEANSRSMNAEIVARLESSFQPIDMARPTEFADAIEVTIKKSVEVTMQTLEKRGWLPPGTEATVTNQLADGRRVAPKKKG